MISYASAIKMHQSKCVLASHSSPCFVPARYSVAFRALQYCTLLHFVCFCFKSFSWYETQGKRFTIHFAIYSVSRVACGWIVALYSHSAVKLISTATWQNINIVFTMKCHCECFVKPKKRGWFSWCSVKRGTPSAACLASGAAPLAANRTANWSAAPLEHTHMYTHVQ